ncbi:hypothetical protein FXO38_23651 [Capsicum annuum]|nr:hypothetical protein FXO38_23651 [Capsicum annuum]KAF3652985.1 hypothetical protein FXO37_17219 [Capsicum annuum]
MMTDLKYPMKDEIVPPWSIPVCCKESGPSLVNNRAAYEVNCSNPEKGDILKSCLVEVVCVEPDILKEQHRLRKSK